MKPDRRLLAAVVVASVVAAVLIALWIGFTAFLVGSALGEEERRAVAGALAPRLPLVIMTALMLAGVVAYIVQFLYRHWAGAAARLAEQTQVLLATDVEREVPVAGAAEVRSLARMINELARQRDELRRDVERRVLEASRSVEQERNRLAALMSELRQSVVVCNLDGRILLYNNRARLQARALSAAPTLAGGAEVIGLGRSIYTLVDRKLVAHALENIQQRLERGSGSPATQFVTVTRSGQLLRAQMTPVRAVDPGDRDGPAPLAGFVLLLDNITREFEKESERDRLLHGLTEASRGSLANLRAAVELLDDAALDAGTRERLLGVVRDETGAMSERISELATRSTQGLATRWPLEEMLGADLVEAAQRRIESLLGLQARTDSVDGAVWLKLDSFSMLQALVYLAGRLKDERDVRLVRLRLAAADGTRAHLDLVWPGRPMNSETAMSWEMDPMRIGAETSPLTLRDVVRRHDGEFWFGQDRVRQEAFFRFLLPLASDRPELEAGIFVRQESRPEYYDFDLFGTTEASRALDDRRLADLTYTVFDTETTGLEPSAGDEIIQIGAVRIVNGKLLRAESFEQLVDPRRPVPAASIPIHGIQPEMLAGQPTIETVLPAFHAYAHDTVLVAHNAAFDMRFLQLKEEATGVRFDQPVLDTLLLSAVVHPAQESHKLEAIAERFDVAVIGRHTALGDAIVTAEVFLKLIALLAGRGIVTLGQAREAARKSYLARIQY